AGGDGVRERTSDICFTVREGEIRGVAGVAGNGQRELAEAVTGMRPAAHGIVRVCTEELRLGDRPAGIEAGLAHAPEDGRGTGAAPSLSIAENAVLKSYRGSDVST